MPFDFHLSEPHLNSLGDIDALELKTDDELRELCERHGLIPLSSLLSKQDFIISLHNHYLELLKETYKFITHHFSDPQKLQIEKRSVFKEVIVCNISFTYSWNTEIVDRNDYALFELLFMYYYHYYCLFLFL
jgi:hypothetical protein